MENEMFTFVSCSHLGHNVEYIYCSRKEADVHFTRLVSEMHPTSSLFVAYYCPSVGGLVNAHYLP